jgi:hypothetical protein
MQAHYHELYHSFQSERRVNVNDELADAELESIRRAKEKLNGSHEPPKFCNCPETLINGKRVAAPPGHCCEYSKARSALVSKAIQITNGRMGDLEGDSQHARAWTKYFVLVMETLSASLLKQSNGANESLMLLVEV